MKQYNKDEVQQLKSKDVKVLREKLYYKQNGICPVLKEKIDLKDAVLDHQHKLFKDQELIIDGNGLIRGVLERTVNSFEGKVFNAYRRLGLHKKDISLPELLRNLADYYEQDPLPYIHPTEHVKRKLLKSSYNRLKKVSTKKLPKYTGNLTKLLEEEFKKHHIEPELR